MIPNLASTLAVVVATAFLATASFAADGPALPPAEYKPLPVGTLVLYDDRSHKVVRAEGFTTVFETVVEGRRSYREKLALFAEVSDNLFVTTSNERLIPSEISSADRKVIESFWPLEVGKQISYRLVEPIQQWIAEDSWTIRLEVEKTETLGLNGFHYPTFVIKERGQSDAGKLFEGRKWYHPAAGLVIKAERAWIKSFAVVGAYYPKVPRFYEGEVDNYNLKTVRFPEGTTTHALKGTDAPTAADEALLAEVERLRQALAARADAGAPAPAVAALGNIEFGRYHALVIGIDAYEHLPKLKTAVNDARAVARVLGEDYGFRVRTLIDPDHDELIDALDEYRETLGPRDNLLIYYAGHGWLDEEVDRGYWLPANAQPKRRSGWVSNATITDTLKGLAAKHVMVVADSCYSGTLVRSADVGARTRTGDYWKQMAEKFARVAITSGGLEPVADKGDGGHSPFAKAFIDTLQGNEGVMDGTQLFTKMRRPVMVSAKQTPQYSDVREAGHDGGDFLFVRRK